VNRRKWIFGSLLGKRLPRHSGDLKLKGIDAPLEIRRDSYGIPTLSGASEKDIWFGLGFCQGQDRTFQVEMITRIVRGELSELIGRKMLNIDRLSRRIGFRRSAERQFAVMPAKQQQIIRAFVEGYNLGSTVGLTKRPHEFAILRSKPLALTPEDPLAIAAVMSFFMPSNWDSELARLKILREDGAEAVKETDCPSPEWLEVSLKSSKVTSGTLDRVAEDLAELSSLLGPSGGSNNWVLSGERTATGRPLLVNDPHLGPTCPPQWYLCHLKTPEWEVAGAGLVGTPGVAAGHNGKVAWGMTAGLIDNVDLYLEEVNEEGTKVRQGDHWVPCEVIRETIRIRGGKSVEEEVLITPRGPIVGPALEGEWGAISFQATWLQPRPLRGVLEVHKVRNFDEFRNVFKDWSSLSLYYVYADPSHIARQLCGLPPIRKKGFGVMPSPGWDAAYGWEKELADFEKMPYEIDPPEGFLVTANNEPENKPGTPFLGHDWFEGYRASRITEVLRNKTDWDVKSSQLLQTDLLSLPWRDMKQKILSSLETNSPLFKMMAAWDGQVAEDSAAATVFEFFLAHMTWSAARVKAPKSAEWVVGKGFGHVLVPFNYLGMKRVGWLARLIREEPKGWFPEGWLGAIRSAMEKTWAELSQKFGSDPAKWAWGTVRPMELLHPLGEVAALRPIFNLGPFPAGGDRNTIAQAGVNSADILSGVTALANLRMVIDVGAWSNSRFALAGGQSGNPFSPHYSDLLPLWRKGEGVPIAWTEAEVAASTKAVLRLRPE
jgi:penicillin G amidase